jgi:hypothetical protein
MLLTTRVWAYLGSFSSPVPGAPCGMSPRAHAKVNVKAAFVLTHSEHGRFM